MNRSHDRTSPRLAAGAALPCFAALVAMLVAAAAAAAPRLEVRRWDATLAPPVFARGDTLARRSHPPRDVATSDTGHLSARRAAHGPVLDGDLAEWRLVRWNDIVGPGSRWRGVWDGDADLSLRFALQWDAGGLWLAATLRDDALTPPDAPRAAFEHVTLALASRSPVVQRYWMAGSRAVRVHTDGSVEAWTDLRNRRREALDAAALGVRAAVKRAARPAEPTLDLELFVPWSAIFPLAPDSLARPLCNVFVDDLEAGEQESVAWSLAPNERRQPEPRWVRLDLAGGGEPLVIDSGPHAESVHEWLVLPGPSAGTGRDLRVRLRGAGLDTTLRGSAARAPFMLCVRDLPPASGWAPASRDLEVEIRNGTAPPVAQHVRRTPHARILVAGLQDEPLRPAAAADTLFPQPADIAVRLQRAAAAVEAIGDWPERRQHTSGIVAHRMATWAGLERWLDEAEVLRAVRRKAPDAGARLDALWARRAPSGVPLGTVVLRGYVSAPDGSVQPYALMAPADVAQPVPLVIALHGLDDNEMTLFEQTTLAAQCSRAGFAVVCPYGRGNSGYWMAGERDVLDVVAAVRSALPIDGKRLYATGVGVGGTATWMLALRHRDLLAAAAPVSAYGDFDQNDLYTLLGYQPPEREWFSAHHPIRLLRPGPVTAFRIVHGERDPTVSVVHARIMSARLTELGVEHDVAIDPQGGHGMPVLDADLGAMCAFFARHARPTPGVPARVFAGRGGPVCDVFARGPFAIVFGTRAPGAADDAVAAQELAAEWRRRFAGDAVVLPDTALADATGANLLLVGTPASNVWLERWQDQLPVRYEGNRAIVNGTPWGLADQGVVWAGASPADGQHSIVVCSGMRSRALGLQRSVFTVASDCMIVGPGRDEFHIERLGSRP